MFSASIILEKFIQIALNKDLAPPITCFSTKYTKLLQNYIYFPPFYTKIR